MIVAPLRLMLEEFQTNWVLSTIHEDNTKAAPNTDHWIHIDVEPLANTNISYQNDELSEHITYITIYHRNKIQAAALTDAVISFICNRQLGNLRTKSYRPISGGGIFTDTYFYKIAVEAEYHV